MRFRLAVLVAVTSSLTVVSPALAGPYRHEAHPAEHHTAAADWAFVQRQLYEVSLRTFTTISTRDPWFDWSHDGCSAPLVGNSGLSFDFRSACNRHDFGYRNLKLLERRYGSGTTYWNGTNRRRVDQQFLADMKAHCRTRSFLLQPSCFGWAETFYVVVRALGGP